MNHAHGPGAASCKFANLTLNGVTGDGRFSGYASVFGEVDLGKDRIERGAFGKSLSARGAGGVRMLFQHDPAEPIGAWTRLVEDARGLFVEGVLSTGVTRAREVHQLMKSGALDGLSIGFQTVKARTDAKTGIRSIVEADLWEISVVTFPMLPSARVESVKHLAGHLPTKREIERRLTRDAGLTRKEARRLIARGYDDMAGLRDAAGNPDIDGDEARLLALMRRAARLMSPRH
ncbi:HK97 family phage prohead protease [Rhizobium sp. NRK18]|uniref:HK97 family phage prohead protease n=1 Tax=Rhizobium sp. NRK18 TaxID=2964667 RepID=UPI0021C392C6|nr:HK97 family phage prohead protease [Rhizobium sp. NRK18]MCQ2004890.1 HK97 family phage prohead protease [Rhizobium sp. NRK18]